MQKRTNIGADAARMARAAQSDLASLQRAMREAEDNLAGLHRMLKVPNTEAQRHIIKGTRRTQPFLATLLESSLGTFAGDILTGGSASFLPSAGQFAAQITNASLRGQRIL